MAGELDGQVVVITGGARGIGRGIAEGFAAAGAKVAIADRLEAELAETVAAIERAGGRAIGVPGDVTNRDDVLRVKERTEAELGLVTTLVCNAGVLRPAGPLWEVDAETWWRTMEIHVRGSFLYINTFVPGMVERGGGRVIVVSTSGGGATWPYNSAYIVSKNTLSVMVAHLAAEGRQHNVFAWSISPAGVFTELVRERLDDPVAQKYMGDVIPAMRERFEEADPKERLAQNARFCIDLASGKGDALSGRYISARDDIEAMVRAAASEAQQSTEASPLSNLPPR
jgi:NAD(P)-dependent dehydrogenase (short-subunit alcohol dehydrogenase family)